MVKVCYKCKVVKELSEFHKDKREKYGLQSKCKSCVKKYNKEYHKEYHKEYRQANKEKMKEYRQSNKERIKERQKEYEKERRKTDSLFKMKCNLRSRTWKAFKNKGYSKNTRTQKMLGVDWEVAKQHIESQFTKGMNWDNQGEWHIDHITPLASANTEEELMKLCHYANLQPLWAEDNLSKKDKIIEQQIKFRI
jgi:hypothetical protein